MSHGENKKNQRNPKQSPALENNEILKPILAAIQDTCNYDSLALYADLDGKLLTAIVTYHRNKKTKNSGGISMDDNVIREIIRKGKPVNLTPAKAFSKSRGSKISANEHHMIFPLSVQGCSHAGFVISKKSSMPFTRTEFTETGELAVIVALALQNHILAKKLRDKEETVNVLGELLLQTRNELDKTVTIAEKSINTRKDFLGRMNHELRTPINGVLGLTHLLLSAPHSDEHAEYLHNIRASGERLLSLVSNMLEASDIETGKLEVEQIIFNPAELIKGVIDNPAVKATGKNLPVHVSLDLPKNVMGDPVRLNKIMINLISNAFKFTTEGHITVKGEISRTEGNKVWLRFIVADTGRGIAARRLSSLFDILSEPGDTDGPGFGLFIVRHLVEIQNGTIAVSSQPGKGSEFIIEIPYDADNALKKKAGIETGKELKPFRNVRILLAEDNAVNQVVALRTLEKWNIEVTIATNGREALEKLRQQSFDMVIMDIQMPEMDGIEAAGTIRESFPEPVKNIPIMAMTACLSDDSIEDFRKAGINDHLAKPFRPKELYKKISQLLAVR